MAHLRRLLLTGVALALLIPTHLSMQSHVNPVVAAPMGGSADVAVAATGDATGFHVLTAKASEGYHWRVLGSLSEPGMDTDQWIGNACLAGSGDAVVAIYAPRQFANKSDLFARGAFAASIDLRTGVVTKLADQVTLAYFNPGCGIDGRVALTQGATEGHPSTRLLMFDTAKRRITTKLVVPGQVTSAIPHGDAFAAARGHTLVEITTNGKMATLATAESVPFDIRPAQNGALVFAEWSGAAARVRYLHGSTDQVLAAGALGDLGVQSGTSGRVFLTGQTAHTGDLPAGVVRVGADAEAQVSSEGGLAIREVVTRGLKERGLRDDPIDQQIAGVRPPLSAEPIAVTASVLATGADANSLVQPPSPGSPGSTANPRLAAPRAIQQVPRTQSGEGTVDDGYTCAVPRNDPAIQVYQPHWRQVEWAVDQLVMKRLAVTRPANWKGSGLPAWSPQSMFTPDDLRGNGRVPTNIMLGILAQESNLWQAQRMALEGETGNPLIGNYYGVNVYDGDPANDWAIDFSKADCGYGISQQTDGMRKAGSERPGETAWPPDKQKAVAVDYVTNIAAGLKTLTQKWNQIWDDTGGAMKANNGDPAKLENWYFAVWAYNSGWHLKGQAAQNDGAWGLGWANNPSNSVWRPGRRPFLDGNSYADAATPQYWPYQEKVLGWAGWPIIKTYIDSSGNVQEQPGYNQAGWVTSADRSQLVPALMTTQSSTSFVVDINAFCRSSGTDHNSCQPGDGSNLPPGQAPAGTCLRADFTCWWHVAKAWKSNCVEKCGIEGTIRYSDSVWATTEREEPLDYWMPCKTPGLPSGAWIIDDVSRSIPAIRGNCDNSGWTNSGTLSFDFGQNSAGRAVAKADFQQLGNGFGGHQWFAYSRKSSEPEFTVTGTWQLDRAVNGPARIFVHLPDHYGYTKRAHYEVATAKGRRVRIISQDIVGNKWVPIGSFLFDGVPKVSLSTVSEDGTGKDTVVWDAIAIQPINGTFSEDTIEAVALFDENQNIDGQEVNSWLIHTPLASRQNLYDWALSLSEAVTALPSCSGSPAWTCVMPRTRDTMTQMRADILAAGMDPVDHPPGKGLVNWIDFANPYTYRPTSSAKPGWFDVDPAAYKISSKITVSFIKDPATNKIIDGSEYVAFEHQTGNTVLPKFVRDFFAAVAQDYGISKPDLTYSAANLNQNRGQTTPVDASVSGILPGRAFPDKGQYELVDSTGKTVTGLADCVYTRYTSGGVIGYGPMLGARTPSAAVENWATLLQQRRDVPAAVAQMAVEIYNLLFRRGEFGSPFNNAPAIWHSFKFDLCADGSIHRRDGGRPIFVASYMPDEYLYRNRQAIDTDGAYRNSAEPVYKGDFLSFSNLPVMAHNPYGGCLEADPRQGNPWGILPPGAGIANPETGGFCAPPPVLE